MVTTDPEYFRALAWCKPLIDDPRFDIVPSRFGRPDISKRGEFFTRTLATDDTITACVYQRRENKQNNQNSKPPASTPSDGIPLTTVPIVPEIRAFLATSSGVNGFPGIAHGGFVAAIIDEVMGFLINSNQALTEVAAPDASNTSRSTSIPMTKPGASIATGELTIKYRSPVPTGEAILAHAWIESIQGRKMIVKATLQDSDRNVLIEGHALFIALKPGLRAPEKKKKKGVKL